MHADQQRGLRVEQPDHGVLAQRVREQRTVRQRELQVPGDEHGVERFAVRRVPVGDHGDRLHGGEADPFQRAEQVVLLLGDALAGLLDRIDGAGQLDESDDVPRDALWQRDQVVGGPLLQRCRPREVEQRRVYEAEVMRTY